MRTQIKATNITLSPAIEEYIDKKTAAFEKFISPDDTASHLSVEVGKSTEHHKSGDVFFAEFHLHISGKDFRARKEAGDTYAAIDMVKDELADMLRGYKDKKKTLLRHGGKMIKDMMRGFNRKKSE